VSDPRARPLREADVAADPLEQFRRWYGEAAVAVELPDAMALATAARDRAPSVRMVLLKLADERGFSFFTGYESRKGRELAANPQAALLFYWHALGRQVRIDGTVERLPDAESDAYFETRPAGAQLSAAASRQSEVIASRDELEARVTALAGDDVERPSWWGGYVLVRTAYAFWQHRENRLHDRVRYRRDRDEWVVERLSP